MKILIVNTSDIQGGAARAAYRIHKGLRKIGVDSHLRVQIKMGNEPTVSGHSGKKTVLINKVRLLLDQIPVLLHRRHNKDVFAPAWLPDRTWLKILADNPDIIHLHWITKAFIQIESLARFNKPIVWTLHDMWAFTGGCHYDVGCGRFRIHCGACPILESSQEHDLSHRVLSRKYQALQNLNLTIVTPSRWLANCAKESALLGGFRVEVIPNGLDLSLYQPMNKDKARVLLGLPTDKQLILFGAMDATDNKRKGFGYLQTALQELAKKWSERAVAIVFGAFQPKKTPQMGLPIQYLGPIQSDEKLVALYSAADVFVAPSVQENLSNTVMESLACGTPCVAFDIGGMPDMIEHEKNGYLAKPYQSEELTKGIAWVLEDQARWQFISQRARAKVEQKFELSHIARRYLALYEELLSSNQTQKRATL